MYTEASLTKIIPADAPALSIVRFLFFFILTQISLMLDQLDMVTMPSSHLNHQVH